MASFDGARPPSSVTLKQQSRNILSLKELCKVSIVEKCKITSWQGNENIPNCLKKYLKTGNY